MTRGKMPYPGIAIEEIISFLEQGERQEKPHGCPEEIYEIMKDCWKASPNERPTFSEVETYLEVN
eukprot:m.193241 g.193241  ORF g.193241 m.193241 type:complete len:65 (+) comp39476_c0_seq47:2358-2552(+)